MEGKKKGARQHIARAKPMQLYGVRKFRTVGTDPTVVYRQVSSSCWLKEWRLWRWDHPVQG